MNKLSHVDVNYVGIHGYRMVDLVMHKLSDVFNVCINSWFEFSFFLLGMLRFVTFVGCRRGMVIWFGYSWATFSLEWISHEVDGYQDLINKPDALQPCIQTMASSHNSY